MPLEVWTRGRLRLWKVSVRRSLCLASTDVQRMRGWVGGEIFVMQHCDLAQQANLAHAQRDTMGASSSKAARTLSKTSTTTAVRGSGGAGSSAPRSAPSPAATTTTSPGSSSSSRPHGMGGELGGVSSSPSSQAPTSRIPVGSETLHTADRIGQVGRQASPLERDPRVGPVPGRSEGASESKDAAIRRDALDPHFLSQLHKLGPVQIPGQSGGGMPQAAPSQMQRILRARREREERLEAEREAAKSARGSGAAPSASSASTDVQGVAGTAGPSLDVNTLGMLLDERKSCTSRQGLSTLALEYDVDMATLDVLTRRFNTPSVGAKLDTPEEEQLRREGQLDTPPRMLAVWTEPNLLDGDGQQGRALPSTRQ
ncbi:unnamed protein product [Parajaminaea phylloscopi]